MEKFDEGSVFVCLCVYVYWARLIAGAIPIADLNWHQVLRREDSVVEMSMGKTTIPRTSSQFLVVRIDFENGVRRNKTRCNNTT